MLGLLGHSSNTILSSFTMHLYMAQVQGLDVEVERICEALVAMILMSQSFQHISRFL